MSHLAKLPLPHQKAIRNAINEATLELHTHPTPDEPATTTHSNNNTFSSHNDGTSGLITERERIQFAHHQSLTHPQTLIRYTAATLLLVILTSFLLAISFFAFRQYKNILGESLNLVPGQVSSYGSLSIVPTTIQLILLSISQLILFLSYCCAVYFLLYRFMFNSGDASIVLTNHRVMVCFYSPRISLNPYCVNSFWYLQLFPDVFSIDPTHPPMGASQEDQSDHHDAEWYQLKFGQQRPYRYPWGSTVDRDHMPEPQLLPLSSCFKMLLSSDDKNEIKETIERHAPFLGRSQSNPSIQFERDYISQYDVPEHAPECLYELISADEWSTIRDRFLLSHKTESKRVWAFVALSGGTWILICGALFLAHVILLMWLSAFVWISLGPLFFPVMVALSSTLNSKLRERDDRIAMRFCSMFKDRGVSFTYHQSSKEVCFIFISTHCSKLVIDHSNLNFINVF
eukprot:gb/GECH01008900.1/.p1 GENE.gb/GECH01008900.1/~~gb/GECH01008900.1/.p1  ORF type:complete len:457 (+),score=57.88 gb/GECH01008900.1/:1-1371(+)